VLRRVLILVSVLACTVLLAQDEQPTRVPSTAPATIPATGPVDGEWQVNSYLHGTTSEIRDQVNSEVERLLRLRHTREAAVKVAIDTLASAKGAKQRDAKAALKQAQDALRETETAVARAYLWRRQMVELARSKYLLHWPLRAGKGGLLGVVTPVKIDHTNSSVTLHFPALQRLRVEDRREGITRQKVLIHDVQLLITGVDLAKVRVGLPVALDANFVVVSQDADPHGEPVYTLTRKADDVDELMSAINDLHDDIDPKEMSRMVRESVPKKSNVKTWMSVDRILSATRPIKDPAAGSADFKRVSSWLERELPGDRVAMRVNVLKVLPREDGNWDFHGTIDAGEDRMHFVIGTLLASAIERGKRSERQPDQRIRGTVLDAHLSEEGTVILELIDIDFGW
jgi:hypothetical protein